MASNTGACLSADGRPNASRPKKNGDGKPSPVSQFRLSLPYCPVFCLPPDRWAGGDERRPRCRLFKLVKVVPFASIRVGCRSWDAIHPSKVVAAVLSRIYPLCKFCPTHTSSARRVVETHVPTRLRFGSYSNVLAFAHSKHSSKNRLSTCRQQQQQISVDTHEHAIESAPNSSHP